MRKNYSELFFQSKTIRRRPSIYASCCRPGFSEPSGIEPICHVAFSAASLVLLGATWELKPPRRPGETPQGPQLRTEREQKPVCQLLHRASSFKRRLSCAPTGPVSRKVLSANPNNVQTTVVLPNPSYPDEPP